MFTVVKIIDGNTIEVSPNWRQGNSVGNKVKILGYTLSNKEYETFATGRLNTLIKDKAVELKNALPAIENNVLSCKVYLNDVDISRYFPELTGA